MTTTPNRSDITPSRLVIARFFILLVALAPAYFLARAVIIILALLFASPYPGQITSVTDVYAKTVLVHFTFYTTSQIKSESALNGSMRARISSHTLFPSTDPQELPVTVYHLSLGPFSYSYVQQLTPVREDSLYYLIPLGLMTSLIPVVLWFLIIAHPRRGPSLFSS